MIVTDLKKPSGRNPGLDSFFEREDKWHEEFALLRKILLSCELTEEFKWGQPCYSYRGRKIVLIHGFKDYCALLFMKGALLPDRDGLLVQQTKNVQSARQLRFRSVEEIRRAGNLLSWFVHEAIEVEKSGRTVKFKATAEFEVPEELRQRFGDDPAFKSAFEALTPGRQRGYLLHFAGAKQAKTREARIDRALDRIFAGKGLDA